MRYSLALLGLPSLLIAAAAIGGVPASTTVPFSQPMTGAAWSQSFAVPTNAFPPNSMEVAYESTFTSRRGWEQMSAHGSAAIQWFPSTYEVDLYTVAPGGVETPITTLQVPIAGGFGVGGPFDGAQDCAGTSGMELVHRGKRRHSATITDPAVLSLFATGGDVIVRARGRFWWGAQVDGVQLYYLVIDAHLGVDGALTLYP